MTEAMHPDTDTAQAFLNAIATGEPVTFQTFGDTPSKRPALIRTIHAAAGVIPPQLAELNAQGAGVFWTVNRTDGKGRKAENITAIRALFLDFDTADDTRPDRTNAMFNLPPSAIVESSPGKHHVYWLVPGWPPDQFTHAQATLAAHFGADPKIKDLPRVMRLPGFIHHKGEPFESRIIELSGHRYDADTVADWLATLTPQDAPAMPLAAPPQAEQREGDPYARKALENALGRIAGSAPGERNDTLNREAHGVYGLHHAGRITDPTAQLHKAARAAGLNDGEIQTTLESARNSAQPRHEGLPATVGNAEIGIQIEDLLNAFISKWPEPLPLTAKIPAEAYPADALPPMIRAAVAEVQGFVQAPVALVATCALSALSLAVQAHIDVERAEKLHGPSGQFFLTIADSGERKTTADVFFTDAIREYEKAQREAAAPLLKDYEAKMAGWEAVASGIRQKLQGLAKDGKNTEKQEEALRKHQHDQPVRPRYPRMIYTDATPEALRSSLAKQWPSGGIVSSEGGSVFGGHGLKSDSAMRYLADLNTLWDGKSLHVDRKTEGYFSVEGVRLTMSVQIQEATLRAYLDGDHGLTRGTGFLARCLIAWPESTMGTRQFREAPASWPALSRFNKRLSEILHQPVSIDDDGRLSPAMLTLSPAGFAAWRDFHDEVERELPGEYVDLKDVAAKAADNVARLAALFHVIEGKVGPIDDVTVLSAAEIVTWHLGESKRFFGEIAMPQEQADAVRLSDWLTNHCRQKQTRKVATRDAQRLGPVRDKSRLDAAADYLGELQRAFRHTEGKRRFLVVNPHLLGGDA